MSDSMLHFRHELLLGRHFGTCISTYPLSQSLKENLPSPHVGQPTILRKDDADRMQGKNLEEPTLSWLIHFRPSLVPLVYLFQS